MRPWIASALAALLLLLPLGAGRADAHTAYVQPGERAILYQTQDESGPMLGCFLPGTPVTILSYREDLCRVCLDHRGESESLTGYMPTRQLSLEKPQTVPLPPVTLRAEEGSLQVGVNTPDQNVLLTWVQTGTSALFLGQVSYNAYAVLVDGMVGSVPKAQVDFPSGSESVEGLLDEGFLAAMERQEANVNAYFSAQEAARSAYGEDDRLWPLETLAHLEALEEACGWRNAWIADVPGAGELEEAEARARAVEIFETMWGQSVEEDGWTVYRAFGVNRMQPRLRLWEFTFSKAEVGDFRIQLVAGDGALQRTSETRAFAAQLALQGYTVDDALAEWTERLGREWMDWTIDEQYEFAQLPVAVYSNFAQDAVLPGPGDVPLEEAADAARLALIQRYGVEGAELDAMKLCVQAQENANMSPEPYYLLEWRRFVPEENLWGIQYTAVVNMTTGAVGYTTSPTDGNG